MSICIVDVVGIFLIFFVNILKYMLHRSFRKPFFERYIKFNHDSSKLTSIIYFCALKSYYKKIINEVIENRFI